MSTDLRREFPLPAFEDWRKEAERLLKGAPFDKVLLTETYEGITLQPLYMQAPTDCPGVTTNLRFERDVPWEIAQTIPYPDAGEFNRALLADLERGQTTAALRIDQAGVRGLDRTPENGEFVGMEGTSITNLSDLETALDGVDLRFCPVRIEAGNSTSLYLPLLVALAERRGLPVEELRGTVAMDPLGAAVLGCPLSREWAFHEQAEMLRWALRHHSPLRVIRISSQPYAEAGASATGELAFVTASMIETLNRLTDEGLSVDDICAHTELSFSLGPNFFMEIAKLRAIRRIWAQVIATFGGSEKAREVFVHATTANWNLSVNDPWVNMLRTTTEALSGVLGGADSLEIAPFDRAVRNPDEFSRRIARNIHMILTEEAHFNQVVDPGAGSGLVESLTCALIEKSWEQVREIEAEGGMAKALEKGTPQKQVQETAGKRIRNAHVRKDVYVGVNMFPNLLEKALEDNPCALPEDLAEIPSTPVAIDPAQAVESMVAAYLNGSTIGMMSRANHPVTHASVQISTLTFFRVLSGIEDLRRRIESLPERPKVFLANMGPMGQHKARADFSTGFFSVAGFKMISNKGFATPEEAAEAAAESGAAIAVVCSTDDTYPGLVPVFVKCLKARRPQMAVVLAGYPKDQIEDHRNSGIDEFIHVRADIHEILLGLAKRTGVLA